MSLTATQAGRIRQIAEQQLATSDSMAHAISREILAASPELASDPALAASLEASTRANVRRILTLQVADPDAPPPADAPPEAIDLARAMVRRGIDLDLLGHAYRRGQNRFWLLWMEVAADLAEASDLPAILVASAGFLFSYMDKVQLTLAELVERERAELISGELARRERTLRMLIDGEPLDPRAAGATLGYELDRLHTAFVVYGEDGAPDPGELSLAADRLTAAAGSGRGLRLADTETAVWGWLGGRKPPDLDALRGVAADFPGSSRAALGGTRRGVEGLRNSYADLRLVHRMLSTLPLRERLVAFPDVEVLTLLGAEPERLHRFVADMLARLAADEPGAAKLRETLRVYLDEGDNSAAAAERLNTHRNTVLHRVGRAKELLGRPLDGSRLPICLALELTERVGLAGELDPARTAV